MPLAYSTEENNPLVHAICDEDVRGVNLNVDLRDEMLLYLVYRHGEDRDRGLAIYFQSGLLLWSTLRHIVEWWFGDASRVGKLLDFASGYGRVTRFLVQDVPPERVWVSDIYADGVAFQEQQFGVHGLVSTADPDDFRCEERFDCILVSSLFTHLPEATFTRWLERLWGLLAPGGMLVFSVHDASLLPSGSTLPGSGLLFNEVSESSSLATAQYGTTWVTEEFVRRVLARIAPGASALRIHRGLVNFQDLWVVVDRPDADFSGLALAGTLDSYVDHCSLPRPDRLEISGWVADRTTGKPVREVRAELDGQVAARCRDLPLREDVAAAFAPDTITAQGFRLSVDLPPAISRTTTPLVLRGVAATGRESVISASSIDAALLRSARLDLLVLHRHLAEIRREATRLGESEARLGWEVATLKARIAAMEASRFWKLRERWFGLKRRLRLHGEP
jgi:SAM-dependent methyltransferase